jgi:hypothetical protein
MTEERSPVLDVIARPGKPLDPPVQRDMEQALGHDFSDVRVHSDRQAQQSAHSVGASAYTVGSNVVLGQGASLSGTRGRELLAHELTHVVQQRKGPVSGTPAPGGIKISDPSDRFEREADRVGREVASGAQASVGDHAGVQRTVAGNDPPALQGKFNPWGWLTSKLKRRKKPGYTLTWNERGEAEETYY